MESYEEKLRFWKLNGARLWTIIAAVVVLYALLQVCSAIAIGVATILVTAVIVFCCHAPVEWFARHGISRLWGTLIVYLVVFVVAVVMVISVVPALVSQGSTLVASLPAYLTELSNFVTNYVSSDSSIVNQDQLLDAISQARRWLIANAGTFASGLGGGVVGVSTALGNALLVIFVSLIAAMWILIDFPKISREVLSLFSEKQRDNLNVIAGSFGTAFYGWLRATFLCAAVNGVLVGVCLFIAGIPYPTALALAVGILYFIPYIGPVFMYVLCGIVGLTVSPVACLITIVINFVINGAVCNFLSPKLMKDNVNVHPAITVIAIVIGGAVGGMVGMLLAVPIVAAVQTIFITYFEAHTGRQICTEDGALFLKVAERPIEDPTGVFKRVKSMVDDKGKRR